MFFVGELLHRLRSRQIAQEWPGRMCDKKRHRKRAKYITLSLESKKGSSQTPMMRSISTVSVLLTMCARVTLVWSAYPFTFTDRECRDLFPERIGKDSLSVNEAHDLPFEIEPSETIHGVSLGGVQGAFLNLLKKQSGNTIY